LSVVRSVFDWKGLVGGLFKMAVVFSSETQKKIELICSKYPNKQAACMPVLHLAQEEYGCLSDEVLIAVSDVLELSYAHVYGVATFYTMYHRKKVGKNILMVCTNVSCMLRGAEKTLAAFEEQLGVKAGETTPDGEFTIIEEECLAACAGAPAVICDKEYFLDVTADKVEDVISACKNRSQGVL